MVSAGLVGLLAFGLAACGDDDGAAPSSSSTAVSTTPMNVYEQQRADGVNALLDDLVAALTGGDKAQLGALIDPLATPEFRDRWYRTQADLGPTPPKRTGEEPSTTHSTARSAPRSERPPRSARPPEPRGANLVLRTFDYTVVQSDAPDRLIGGALGVSLGENGSSDSWVTPVKLRYALGGVSRPGVDEPVIEVTEALAFARYGDEWKLLGDGSLAPDPSIDPGAPAPPPELPPWAFGGVQAADVKTAGGASSILSYPGTEATVAAVRRELGPAVAAVSDFWGDDWAQRAVLMVTGDAAQFAAFTRSDPDRIAAAAAATVYSRIDRGSRTVVGQRVVMAPTAAQLSPAGVAVVLRHELTHVATRVDTAEDAPMWLTEGVAEYVGRRGTDAELTDVAPELAAEVAGGDLPTGLPTDEDFAGSADAARLAYQSSWSFAEFVADRFGDDKLRRMYLAAAQSGAAAQVDTAVESVLGADTAELVRQWQTWLRREVR